MPIFLGNLAIIIATVAGMEIVAWATHRFVMHGWGWGWHRSHHEPRSGVFEKNDLYAVLSVGIALALIVWGARTGGPAYWIGVGMSVYGVLYFVLHDGLVHHRWPFRIKPRQAYLQRLLQAHHLHHAVRGRQGAVSFGFLYAPPIRRLRETLKGMNRS
jgi:beta-carotene 3-hydroxylase